MEIQDLTYRPRLVFWELTQGCNLRCIHCRASATELCSPNDLSTASCSRIIDQLAEFAPFILVLSGGEPLYRKDVFELARYATDKGIRVALATNGTLVTPDIAAQICDAGPDMPGPGDTPALIREARTGRLLPGEGVLPLAELVAALPATLPLAVEAPCGATAALPAVERARRAYRALAALAGA